MSRSNAEFLSIISTEGRLGRRAIGLFVDAFVSLAPGCVLCFGRVFCMFVSLPRILYSPPGVLGEKHLASCPNMVMLQRQMDTCVNMSFCGMYNKI